MTIVMAENIIKCFPPYGWLFNLAQKKDEDPTKIIKL
jgi:hypothetical protein